MMKKLKIGPVETKNNVVLAPMAGVCNPAFRLIAKEFGVGLVCAEMVSDKAILHGNERTRKMLYVDEREKPLSLQIFGGDKESLVEAAKIVDRQTNADIIDINMGCPAPKVVKCDAGARWLLDPGKSRSWWPPSLTRWKNRSPSRCGSAGMKTTSTPWKTPWPSSGAEESRWPCTAAPGSRCTPERPTGTSSAR